MTRTIKIYGPPGTGKTTALKGIALRAFQNYGLDSVAATTFTVAGAVELKQRIAAELGMTVPTEPWAAKRFLSQRLPWVGTIHSLAYKLIGHPPMVKQAALLDWMRSQGSRATRVANPEDLEGYAWAEPGSDEVEAALAVWAAARHRMISVPEAYAVVPWGYQGPTVSLERVHYISKAYEDFKLQTGSIDFEDMLEQALASGERPPVDVVLSDEVQDNSPLLWSVVDAWSVGRDYAMAGDPYQAIYLFSGAKPDLFIEHSGDLVRLGNSRRLTEASAERAQDILLTGGYTEGEWLGTWTGVGTGEETDGSEFWLARTNTLLADVRRTLEDEGEPYGYVRGGGPLEIKAADAFRSLIQLRQRGAIPATAAALIASQSKGLPRGTKAQLERLAKSDPHALVGPDTFGTVEAEQLAIPHAEYYRRVYGHHGIRAFVDPPRTRIGTIHSAKGKEADTVHLIDSWATLPYRSTQTPDGRLAEACVAYVAVTRHRSHLIMQRSMQGTPYPDF